MLLLPARNMLKNLKKSKNVSLFKKALKNNQCLGLNGTMKK